MKEWDGEKRGHLTAKNSHQSTSKCLPKKAATSTSLCVVAENTLPTRSDNMLNHFVLSIHPPQGRVQTNVSIALKKPQAPVSP